MCSYNANCNTSAVCVPIANWYIINMLNILIVCYIAYYMNVYMGSWRRHVNKDNTYRIYLKRSPGVYFLKMILDPACKRVWHLFKPRCFCPIVHLSRVEWQVLVPVYTSLITWLEASTFIKVHGLHSLTKRISACCGKTMNTINTL